MNAQPKTRSELRRRKPWPNLLAVIGLLVAATLWGSPTAQAAAPQPHSILHIQATPTNFSAAANSGCLEFIERCDTYVITATNVGAASSNGSTIHLAAALPPGLIIQHLKFIWSGFGETDLSGIFCTAEPLECKLPTEEFSLPPVEPDGTLKMYVAVSVEEPEAPGLLETTATLSGGGSQPAATSAANEIAAAPPPLGFSAFSSPLLGADGRPDTQAGSHPNGLFTRIDVASELRAAATGNIEPTSVEDVRDVIVDLPLGLVGSALSAPTCTLAQLSSEDTSEPPAARCSKETIVGHVSTEPLSGSTQADSPLYNLAPEHGVAAEFGYVDVLKTAHVLYASLASTPSGYVLRTTSPEIPQIPLTSIAVDFYGDPATRDGGSGPHTPTFTNPSACDGRPLLTHIHMDSWLHPGTYNPDGSPDFSDPAWAAATSEAPPVSGCDLLRFGPSLETALSNAKADSPSGLDVKIKVPQTQTVGELGTPPLRSAVITLPAALTVNPSSANGLAACSLAEVGISPSGEPDAAAPSCPDASKLGTVELETSSLPGILHGEIYLARQGENPFGSLLVLYIVLDDPTTGVLVKIPAEVKADPRTGQLTTTVIDSPQFPFSELRTHFFGGNRAPLRTPATCGSFQVSSQLTPWSAPQSGPPAAPGAAIVVDAPATGSACPHAATEEPNAPHFEAGTTNPTAGAYSPFVLKLARADGSQELSGIDTTMPEGLLGRLAGIAYCPDSALAGAAGKSGAAEKASPSCPGSSDVGVVNVGAGAGPEPFYVQSHAYLAGPYQGAPLSLAIVTPALAGPFDLGTVMVRTALYVDDETAQIHAVSDPIPSILQGIPLDLRSVALELNRPSFTLNPTGCDATQITGIATSTFGSVAQLAQRFQVGGCKGLDFAPKLSLRLKGAVHRRAHPKLIAKLTAKPGEANIARAQVKLPASAFLDNAHIGEVCTRPQFAAHTCPAGSVYGRAKAVTPLLDAPLSGDVYLRANPAHKLPDLVADLNGQIEVALAGETDSVKGALRNTFEAVPDAPVRSFRLELFGGKRGLIEMSTGFCPHPRASIRLTAHNGKVANSDPVVGSSCKKKDKGKKAGRRSAAG